MITGWLPYRCQFTRPASDVAGLQHRSRWHPGCLSLLSSANRVGYTDRARIDNDWDYFVSDVKSPFLPHQEASWGLGNMSVEEIRLDSKNKHATGLLRAIGERQQAPLYITKDLVFDAVTYPVAHVLSHVADQLANFAPDASAGYLGANRDMAKGPRAG